MLDPTEPLVPCDMYRPPNARRMIELGRRSREEIREARALWRYLNSPDVQNHASHSAKQATRLLDSRSRIYLNVNQRWEHDGARAILKAFHNSKGVDVFADFLLASWRIHHPVLRRRFDAVARVTSLRLIRSGLGAERATENDDVDTRLLHHLIDGCALATADEKLRRDVVECGTFQAPWVGTLDEFEATMPDRSPW